MTTKQNRRIKSTMLQCKRFIQTRKKTVFSNSINLKNFDSICLSETWLTNENNCFLSNRRSLLQSTSHGGTLFGVKSGLMPEPASFNFNTYRAAVACYIKLDKRKLLVVSCYLPPANSKYAPKPNELNNLFEDINKLRKNCDLFFYGDFNYPSLTWCNMSSIKEFEISFLEEIGNLEVHQKITFNTASIGTLD